MVPSALIRAGLWQTEQECRELSWSAQEQPIAGFAEGPWLCSSLEVLQLCKRRDVHLDSQSELPLGPLWAL